MCVWSGLWGMGSNGEVHGVTSDFRYQMKLTEGLSAEGPQDGNYNGYFWMKVVPPKRVNDNGLHLHFEKQDGVYLVHGEGQNKLGPFSLTGTYNPVTSTMICEKNYLPLAASSKKLKPKPKPKPRPRSRSEEHLYSQPTHIRSMHASPQTYLRHTSITPRGLSREMSLCYKCLRHLMSHKWAGPFLQPVDPIALDLPDYFDIVKNPMDFGTLQRRIETQMVTSKEEFAALARQIFANALLYNKPDSDVGVMARVLSEEFEKEFLQITGRIFAAGPEPSRAIPAVSRRSQTFEEPAAKEPRVAKPAGNQRAKRLAEMAAMEAQIQNLQGKITQMEREIQAKKKGGKTEVDTRPMTVEEKKALSVQIGQLNEAEVAGLLAIVKESIPEEQNHQEAIELDFNMLPNEILRQMERYIKECKEARNSSRKHRKTYTHTKESLFDYDDNHFVDDFDNTDSAQEEY